MPHDTIKILYVAGAGRSGSTVLANILGEVEGFCSVGEIRHIWDGIVNGWFCGCGTPLRECAFWADVLTSAYGGSQQVDAMQLRNLRDRGLRSRHLLLPGMAPRKMTSEFLQAYLTATKKLYVAIYALTRSRVIVDASKAASYRYLLANVLGFEVYTLHLVRDPRAVAYAWWYRRKRRSPQGSLELLDRYHPIETALRWHESNALTRRMSACRPDRYRLVRYEDFVRNPQQILTSVLEWVGADTAQLPFAGQHVTLSTHHTVSGNPERFRRGRIHIKADEEEWRTKMSYIYWMLVSAITWPESRKYNYPLFGILDSQSERRRNGKTETRTKMTV